MTMETKLKIWGAALAFLLSISEAEAQTPQCVVVDKAAPAVLTWTDNATNESGFRIYREVNGVVQATPFFELVGANLVTFTDSSLVQDKLAANTYVYDVSALNSSGESTRSNKACKTIKQAIPDGAPTSLTIK